MKITSNLPNLTHNNHFKFGYDGGFFNVPRIKWNIEYGKISRPIKSFGEECLLTAELIYNEHAKSKPIYLCLSGGIDSEIIALSFLEKKIPFVVAIMRFNDGLNEHDIKYSIDFCLTNNINYKIFDLNVEEFYLDDAKYYADASIGSSATLLTHCWLIDEILKLGGYPILGSAECFLWKSIKIDYIPGFSPYKNEQWYMWEREVMATTYRFLLHKNSDGCPGFFQFTPEIMLSFLKEDRIIDLISNKINGKLTSENAKFPIYKKYFDIQERPKYTGFELILKRYYPIMFESVKQYPLNRQIINMKYEDVIDHLTLQ